MLNDQQIKGYCVVSDLVTPFDEEYLQPNSIDLRLGYNFKVPSSTPGVFTDLTLREEEGDRQQVLILEPHEFVLAHTFEVVKMPKDIVGFVAGKSTIARNGLQIEAAGLLDSEFEGQVTLELFNMSPWPLTLKPMMAICQAYFVKSEAPTIKSYSLIGHYNNQRGATTPVFKL